MRTTCALTAALAGLAASVASAGSFPVSILVAEGEPLDGSFITGLGSPFTNSLGQVGTVATLDDGRRAILVNGSPIFLSSDALPNVLTGGEASMGIGDSGQFIYSPSFNNNDSVYGETGLIAIDNGPALTGPPGFNNTFHSRPRMIDDGSSYWVSGLNDGLGGTSSLSRIVYFRDGATGTISAPIAAGDVIDGGLVGAGSGIDFDTSYSDNGANTIFIFNDALASGTSDDGCFTVNGQIVARELQANGQGDNWDNFDNHDIDNNGNYVFSGDTDGATTTDEFVGYNGVIALRENDAFAGGIVDGFVDEVSISQIGTAAFIWEFDDGSGPVETLFFASDASDIAGTAVIVASVGDALDLNNDGVTDLVITDFNAGIGSGLDLAEDGRIHVELDVDDNDLVNFEVIATFDTNPAGPCNPADIAEPFGVLDLADINGFVSAFVAQEPAADLAPPMGVYDLSDVNAFIIGFTGGCP